jgi:hypothetical protein
MRPKTRTRWIDMVLISSKYSSIATTPPPEP